MGRLFLLLFLIHLGLAFAAIVDCLGGEQKPERWSRFTWSLVIVFGLLAGPVAWFTHGRPGRKLTGGWLMPGLPGPGPAPRAPRPVAPDDDPDFLSGLGRPAEPRPQEPDDTDPAPDDRP